MPALAPLLHAFEKHAVQRAAGRPTPAVLVGHEVEEAWVGAHRARGVVRVAAADAEDAGRAAARYLDAPIVRSRLAARIEARVLAARALPRATKERTGIENALWTDLAHDALLAAGDPDAALLVTRSGPETLPAALNVLGEDAPALLLRLGRGREGEGEGDGERAGDGEREVDGAVRVAIALAERAPRMHLALATEAPAWRAWTALHGREHAKAMLRVVEPPKLPPELPKVPKVPGLLEWPRAALGETLERARELAAKARATRAAADDDAARSAAERALFEALEGDEVSRGRFVLNRRIDVLFGNRELEIDLACQSLRIAVEVDGYFHFQNTDAYRRDRRKDIVLQQERYFVVRVLAEDITERLDETLAMIHRVMRRKLDAHD